MAESWRFEPKLKKPKKGFCKPAEEFDPEAFVLETFGERPEDKNLIFKKNEQPG